MKYVSTFRTDAFRQFLSQLESFKPTLHEVDYPESNVTAERFWKDFAEAIGPFFLDHLDNATELWLESAQGSNIGRCCDHYDYKYSNCVESPLLGTQCPRLKRLTLVNFWIDATAVEFILDHDKTLESILLRECYIGLCEEDAETPYMSWRAFFAYLLDDGGLPRLVSFDLEGQGGRLVHLDETGKFLTPEARRMVRKLKSDRSRQRPLWYVWISEHGDMSPDTNFTTERFWAMRDQKSFDKFMDMVRGNKWRLLGHE
ncbi:hypothetical protein AJ80_03755 [Polytolypa hystricis UAMH7299]|uniref:Uncharacterized protein n=1 Tax=Polytolypa hystricis (strain UAMH7299) TaxID=1447883 RepID=A0A2B7YFZ8_POLH7|nr:hypothetical protein AJ80_03755 [Polytolypa hystricis UAMH7299]